jgi:hypothetical protein
MERMDVLADYHSDGSEHVRIIARRRVRTGTKPSPDGLEPEHRYHTTSIDVMSDGKLVRSLPLQHSLASFSQTDTERLMSEINALKDSHASAKEVVGELHTLLG